jgi:hypothetical protein
MSGFSPNATSNLPQSRVIFCDNVFVENLKTQTPFVRWTSRRDLPLNSGNQIELFMLNPLGADTVQVAEGAVLSGISVSVGTTTATVGEFRATRNEALSSTPSSGTILLTCFCGSFDALRLVCPRRAQCQRKTRNAPPFLDFVADSDTATA